jgi:thiamine biosynthesis protein ThiI
MKEIFLLKYVEMALKGANRSVFEKVLIKNIRKKLAPLGRFSIDRAQSTITVVPKSDMPDMDMVFEHCAQIFGVAALSRCAAVEKNWAQLFPQSIT